MYIGLRQHLNTEDKDNSQKDAFFSNFLLKPLFLIPSILGCDEGKFRMRERGFTISSEVIWSISDWTRPGDRLTYNNCHSTQLLTPVTSLHTVLIISQICKIFHRMFSVQCTIRSASSTNLTHFPESSQAEAKDWALSNWNWRSTLCFQRKKHSSQFLLNHDENYIKWD